MNSVQKNPPAHVNEQKHAMVSDTAYLEIKMRAAADFVFDKYEFGESVQVTDTDGWSFTTPGHEWTRKVYVEIPREDDGPAPRWVLNFNVRFNAKDFTFEDAIALNSKGEEWGSLPTFTPEIEALGFSSWPDYANHHAILNVAKNFQKSPGTAQALAHQSSEMKVYETGDDSTAWNAKVIEIGAGFQVQVFDADGDQRSEHEKLLPEQSQAVAWACKVVKPFQGRTTDEIEADQRSATIAQAIRLYMSCEVVALRSHVISQIEGHMTSTERGKHFFEVRETLNKLIEEGAYVEITASLPDGQRRHLIAHKGVEFFNEKL